MIDDMTNTKIKPYAELIAATRPVLKKLLDSSCYADPIDGWDTREEVILSYESMDVINTICVIESLGRQHLYTNRRKPFKNPDKVFGSWAKELWEYNEKEKCETIKYICGKVGMRKYIENGIHLLGIC